MQKEKLIVIGGGAGGFFCAVNAARLNPNLQVTLLEKTSRLLSKVKISGGGRCNVTHACFDIAEMSKQYPRGGNFVKKTFYQFFTTDIIQWFEERGVKLKTESDGRMFPVTGSSQTIIDCLLKEADKYGVEIKMMSEVRSLMYDRGRFRIELSDFRPPISDFRQLTSDFVCIACGGYPKSSMFNWLRELGLTFEEPVPSLFTFNIPGNLITKLMGISVAKAKVKIINPIPTRSKLEEEGPILITHWGMSGPAILRLSAWGARQLAVTGYEFRIAVNWIPDFSEQRLSEKIKSFRFDIASQKIINKNPFGLPHRLWEFLIGQSGIKNETRWADLPAKEQNKLIKNLCACEFAVKGKTTFKEEFVTAGGIKLSEVDANTMMSKKIPLLFFAGEILDVDGITGGFNFQHAWTSGFIAAKSIALQSPQAI
jgi:predicted Rossmann fold flavoprotein